MLQLGQYVLGAISGALVGFILALVGGGGSILAVPLLVHLVGVKNPHLAIGTGALAVAGNAATGLLAHWRAGNVLWRCAWPFAALGIAGAALGSTLGKSVPGEILLILFALLMIAVGILMLRDSSDADGSKADLGGENIAKLGAYGFGTGLFSGFFGIGGGFLIVPGLIAATGMSVLNAVGSSLVAVTAFGLTTAFNYALSGLVDWWLALAFLGGGLAGTFAGTRLAEELSEEGHLRAVFVAVIFAVAGYTLFQAAADADLF